MIQKIFTYAPLLFLFTCPAQADSLKCIGEIDSGAHYLVQSELDSHFQVNGLLQVEYTDNDGFQFSAKAQPRQASIQPERSIEISGDFNGGSFRLTASYENKTNHYLGNLSAHGSMGEGLDVDLVCELVSDSAFAERPVPVFPDGL